MFLQSSLDSRVPPTSTSTSIPNSGHMSTLPETSLTLLSQSNSPSPPSIFTAVPLFTVFAIVGLYYASPTCLTHVLVSSLADVENAYLTGVENGIGVLCASTDVDVAERLAVLQLKVSTLREASLRSSLSPLSFLSDTFNICRFVTVLRCLREVRVLKTYIEISQEFQRREPASASESRCQCPLANRASISLRRRDSPTRIYV
ncbi:hypothetical protein MSAN_00678100 [Mycena sanguinolenta]|uniref:Uncharacterized protein n=1 Tax=Mycena sanguinolenta TaxID=230812 RepID=A0A8H6Z1F1_9AGAR|nr:hypothetical protein MSAN_00678100 [Mycena sanguinolenta]